MVDHKFGGDWTQDKLTRLAEYLEKYRLIFTKSEKAKYFRTWYVDGFAGTGSRVEDSPNVGLLGRDDDPETARYFDGSAKIALELKSPFDRYLFIEKSKARCAQLRETIVTEHADLAPRCEFRQQDANEAIKSWCGQQDWKKNRAVVFLDPYGLQVEWSTIEVLGATRAVDLWYLFPLNMRRLLTRGGVTDEGWKKRLDLLFGTREWESRFYMPTLQSGLFGDTTTLERDNTVENIKKFIEERLQTCFHKVAKGLVLKNSRSSPLYSLCFAAANEAGAPIALRIAQGILGE